MNDPSFPPVCHVECPLFHPTRENDRAVYGRCTFLLTPHEKQVWRDGTTASACSTPEPILDMVWPGRAVTTGLYTKGRIVG